jgi:hypothetical protein
MTAFHHAYGGEAATATELSRRTPLQDAAVLYALGVVSEATAARLAGMPVDQFRFERRNQRRIELIHRQTREGLTPSEEAELDQLRGEVRQYVDARHPRPVLAGPGTRQGPHPVPKSSPSEHGKMAGATRFLALTGA